MDNKDKTMFFDLSKPVEDSAEERLKKLQEVYKALVEKGYNPLNQLVGYVFSGDPTYITNHKDARRLISEIDRDELVEDMIKKYLEI